MDKHEKTIICNYDKSIERKKVYLKKRAQEGNLEP